MLKSKVGMARGMPGMPAWGRPSHEVSGHSPMIRIDKNVVRIRCTRDSQQSLDSWLQHLITMVTGS